MPFAKGLGLTTLREKKKKKHSVLYHNTSAHHFSLYFCQT